MKVVNNILRVLSILFSVLTLALFFVNFATVVAGETYSFNAAQFAWGATKVITAKSSHIWFCMALTVITVICSGFAGFKSGKWRYASSGFGLVNGIYLLVIALSSPSRFIDLRPLTGVTSLTYTPVAILLAVAALLAAAACIGYLFTSDYLEVMASNGSKMLLGKRIAKFFRDYKGEVKKIVWPGWKMVVKNTLIVLIMCLLVGAFIWLLDFGLGQLLNLIYRG